MHLVWKVWNFYLFATTKWIKKSLFLDIARINKSLSLSFSFCFITISFWSLSTTIILFRYQAGAEPAPYPSHLKCSDDASITPHRTIVKPMVNLHIRCKRWEDVFAVNSIFTIFSKRPSATASLWRNNSNYATEDEQEDQ